MLEIIYLHKTKEEKKQKRNTFFFVEGHLILQSHVVIQLANFPYAISVIIIAKRIKTNEYHSLNQVKSVFSDTFLFPIDFSFNALICITKK